MSEFVSSLGNEMTCETTPNLDSWIPFDNYWICNDYITYHKMLMADCGMTNQQALDKIEQELQDRTLFGHEYFCQFDVEFRTYFEEQGADFGFLSNIIYSVGGGASNVVDTLESGTSGLQYAGRILRIAVPIVLIAACAVYGYKAFNTL